MSLTKLYRFINGYGLLIALGFAFYFIYIFLVAYFSPQKMVAVDINHYGEARVELWIIIWSFICMTVAAAGLVNGWIVKYKIKRQKNDR